MLYKFSIIYLLTTISFAADVHLLIVKRHQPPLILGAYHRLSRDSLSDILSIDDADRIPDHIGLCYIGEPREICKLVRRLNLKANQLYDKGLHSNIQLTSCTFEQKEIRANVHFNHDWAPESRERQWKIMPCDVMVPSASTKSR